MSAYDLTSVSGYRRFLEASAAALLPLEAALEPAGVVNLFPDWPQRTRNAAIADDLARMGGFAHPLSLPTPLGRNGILGTMYVLEGSRLGAKYFLRTIAGCSEPRIASATRYFRHGSGLPLWPTFLARLESEPITPDEEADIISGALRAFDMFARAALA